MCRISALSVEKLSLDRNRNLAGLMQSISQDGGSDLEEHLGPAGRQDGQGLS